MMRKWAAVLIVSVVATLTFITIPRYPYLIDDALSEKAVLSYAHEHNFQYGKDIVFTYGPLGFLVSRYFFAHAAGVRMAMDFVTCFATAVGIALVAWRSTGNFLNCSNERLVSQIWKWLLLIVFIFLTANIDPRADLVLYIGLFSWGLLCFLESGRELALAIAAFIFLGVFSVLVKANFLVLVGLSAGAIILDLVLRGRSSAAAGTAVGFIATFLLGWSASEQSIWNLTSFFLNPFPITLDYDKTMGINGLPILQQRGWITLPLIFAVTTIRALTAFSRAGARPSPDAASNDWTNGGERWNAAVSPNVAPPEDGRAPTGTKIHSRRALLLIWLSALIFILWKHGFVRAGLFHSGFYFGLLPIVALALEAIPTEHLKAANWARAFGGMCVLICLLTLRSFFFLNLGSAVSQPFRAIPANLRALLRPGEFQRQMLQLQQTQVAETSLPRIRKIVGRSPVDVFGQDQSYAIFNHLNYRPRPIFQSFVAYNTSLMRMNEEFYFSQAAPEYALFRLTPVDRRYPPLEDALLLRDLLINYEPIEGESQFVLLKRKARVTYHEPLTAILSSSSGERQLTTHQPSPKLTLLRQGTVRAGEPILLSEDARTDLWLQVSVKSTLLGHARQFFYKPPVVRLAMWHKSSKQGASWFRAPAPMLDAGFVASPMLANTDDALNLYAETAVSRPYACSIELGTGNERFWQERIAYHVYKIENTLGRCAHEHLPQLLSYAGFQTTPIEVVASSNAFVSVESKPAFFLPIGGYMCLNAPKGTTKLEGKWGLGTSAANAQAANFRIEEEMPGGTMRILQTHVADPGEYGMKQFSVALLGDGEHRIILRTDPTPQAQASDTKGGETQKPLPLSCWADVRFN